jgi:hypothetical protein
VEPGVGTGTVTGEVDAVAIYVLIHGAGGDRFFPAPFQRRVVRERLGITPDEMDGGHLPALARPDELVGWLEHYLVESG